MGAYLETLFRSWARVEIGRCNCNGRRSDQREYCRCRPCTQLARLVTMVSLILAAAGCGGSVTTRAVPPGIDRLLPRSTYRTQQAVLRVWVDGQRQLERYMDKAPHLARPALASGEAVSVAFPNLHQYYTGNALISEYAFLKELKLASLRGPKSFNIGQPRVVSLSKSSATVSFCVIDSGTTTATGAPGPPTLDGGGGGAAGQADLIARRTGWRIANGSSVGVSRC